MINKQANHEAKRLERQKKRQENREAFRASLEGLSPEEKREKREARRSERNQVRMAKKKNQAGKYRPGEKKRGGMKAFRATLEGLKDEEKAAKWAERRAEMQAKRRAARKAVNEAFRASLAGLTEEEERAKVEARRAEVQARRSARIAARRANHQAERAAAAASSAVKVAPDVEQIVDSYVKKTAEELQGQVQKNFMHQIKKGRIVARQKRMAERAAFKESLKGLTPEEKTKRRKERGAVHLAARRLKNRAARAAFKASLAGLTREERKEKWRERKAWKDAGKLAEDGGVQMELFKAALSGLSLEGKAGGKGMGAGREEVDAFKAVLRGLPSDRKAVEWKRFVKAARAKSKALGLDPPRKAIRAARREKKRDD